MHWNIEREASLLESLQHLADAKSTQIRNWIKQGRIAVNGFSVRRGSYPLQQGDTVQLIAKRTKLHSGLSYLYSDRDLIVIEKPAGLLTVDRDRKVEDSAHRRLKSYFSPAPVFPIHRLDRESSGLLVFALNRPMWEQMKKLFAVHDIERHYTAVIYGALNRDKGTWRSHLEEDQAYQVHVVAEDRGRNAITHYEVEKKRKSFSLLRLQLETGRKHQIRVHCQAAGHPIVGDRRYGGHASPIGRMALHAHKLSFTHPRTGKVLSFSSPPPIEFNSLVSPGI